jgi:hypothetical protein
MGRCNVCGKENSKAFLFMPSNVFVFLCDNHAVDRMNSDSSVPITKWTTEQKQKYKDFDTLMDVLEKNHA